MSANKNQQLPGKLFFPKAAVNGFAGDASYQRAEKLAEKIGGVVVSSDDDIRGARPSLWVYQDYADVPAKDYDQIEVDFTKDGSFSDYGFVEVDLPKIGKVLARAVGADEFWRGHVCNSPFRCEIKRPGNWIDRFPGDVAHEMLCELDAYELNWFDLPEAVQFQLIEATNGIKDEYFSKAGKKRIA